MPAERFDTVAVLVLDGVGCGEAADARERYRQDRGSNSLTHATMHEPLDASALQRMGIAHVPGLERIMTKEKMSHEIVRGAFGALEPTFAGNGSLEGHQALMGHQVREPYTFYDETGFPDDLIMDIEGEAARVLGRPVEVVRYPETDAVSGTAFINDVDPQTGKRIGERHVESGDPARGPLLLPVYTSSDSVLQIAIHVDVIAQEVAEELARRIRLHVLDARGRRVGRVILRPFRHHPGFPESAAMFERVSAGRRDFGVDPDGPTVIDQLAGAGIPVHGVGKFSSMLNERGFDQDRIAKGRDDAERIRSVLDHVRARTQGLIVATLVETDELYGHRRNPVGYVRHLSELSRTLDAILQALGNRMLLVVTSDHGNDPTQGAHTNHTRERVPLLAAHTAMTEPIPLGVLPSYGDLAATIAENFSLQNHEQFGQSFLRRLS